MPNVEIDVDALVAAKREAAGAPDEIRFNYRGETFIAVPELPYAFAEAAAMGQYRLAITELIGEEESRRFFEMKPSLDAIEVIVKELGEVHAGTALGNSSASKSSSANTSGRSRSRSPKATPDSEPSPSSSGAQTG